MILAPSISDSQNGSDQTYPTSATGLKRVEDGETRSCSGTADACGGHGGVDDVATPAAAAAAEGALIVAAPSAACRSPGVRQLSRQDSYQLAALHLLGFGQVSPRELPRVREAIEQALSSSKGHKHHDNDGDDEEDEHGGGRGHQRREFQGPLPPPRANRRPARGAEPSRPQLQLTLESPSWGNTISSIKIMATGAGAVRRRGGRRGSRWRRLRRLLVRGAGGLVRGVALLFYVLLAMHFVRAHRKHRATLWEVSFAVFFCACAVLTIVTSAVSSLLPPHRHHHTTGTLLRLCHGLCVGLPLASAVLCVVLARSAGTYRPALAKGLLILILPSLVELMRIATFIPPPTPLTSTQLQLQGALDNNR